MSSELKTIKLWGEPGTPNPAKVAIILEELKLPYDVIAVPFSDVKKPDYIAINPNGRLPSIYDANTGITLWESGAVVEYLIDTYDPEHKLSFPTGTKEFWLAKQWLCFQASGQGPYYGQAGWFKLFHQEKVPSALDRYLKEIGRVTGVLEAHLAQQRRENFGDEGDGPWLVGNKLSYADIAFVPWQHTVAKVFDKEEFDQSRYPLVDEWYRKITSRAAVKKVWEDVEAKK
ncbi:Glutathione S-transferase, domain-containing protein [Cladophialophora immunda]|nr:Glutathione S-transferase, domain-containing protein [Cladophialophora immunda]